MLKERIIYAPGLNGTELLRTMAKCGKNTLALRIMGSVELSRYGLAIAGLSPKERFINRAEESFIIYGIMRNSAYFGSAGLADASKLADTLREARMLITADERNFLRHALLPGKFAEKNTAILDIYDKYIEYLNNNGLVDSVMLLRLAPENGKKMPAEFITLTDYPLSAAERALVEVLSGGKYTEMSLAGLIGDKDRTGGYMHITRARGEINELEDIISRIYSRGLPLDECVIAYTAAEPYSRILYDMSGRLNIPMTFSDGIAITNSYPGRLLRLWTDWYCLNYRGLDALKAMLGDNAFNTVALWDNIGAAEFSKASKERIIELAGNMRPGGNEREDSDRIEKWRLSRDLTDPREKSDALLADALSGLAKELNRGCGYIIEKYSLIRNNPGTDNAPYGLDLAARNYILNTLSQAGDYCNGTDIKELNESILTRRIMAQNSEEGKLHVCSLSAARAAMRQNLFITGLSSRYFPGAPAENYLILDEEFSALAGGEKAPTSENKIEERKGILKSLLAAAAASGAQTELSYSCFDTVELKNCNPSSQLMEIVRRENGGDSTSRQLADTCAHADFFTGGIAPENAAGKAYSRGEKYDIGNIQDEDFAPEIPERPFSPTAIEQYLSCPRRFYLTRILKIKEPEEDDPLTVIDPRTRGTIIHAMMEKLGGEEKPQLEEFLHTAGEIFDREMLARPAVNREAELREKSEFIKIVRSAYLTDPGYETLLAEETLSAVFSENLCVSGIPDRVERTPGGDTIIADYKVKREIEHRKNDVESCIQTMLYAWLEEKNGTQIARSEYRYLRQRETVSCIYDDAARAQVEEYLNKLCDSLENGRFERSASKDACKYCKLADICGKNDMNAENIVEEADA